MSKLVIVVDNVAAVRETLRETFQELYEDAIADGELVVEALADGASLLVRAATQAPDVVFLDVDMPGMDGIETFYRLKDLSPPAAHGVFFLSGLAGAPSTNQRLEQAVADGAGGFMSKPATAAALHAVAERILFAR